LIFLRILGWDANRSWVDWSDYHRKNLEGRLRRLTDLDRVTVKRLARQVRDRECDWLTLSRVSDPLAAESLRSFLQSLGAEAVLEATESGAPADPRRQDGSGG